MLDILKEFLDVLKKYAGPIFLIIISIIVLTFTVTYFIAKNSMKDRTREKMIEEFDQNIKLENPAINYNYDLKAFIRNNQTTDDPLKKEYIKQIFDFNDFGHQIKEYEKYDYLDKKTNEIFLKY